MTKLCVDEMRKGINFAASKWATTYVRHMSSEQVTHRLQDRGMIHVGKKRVVREQLVERMSEEKFILDVTDMFMWSTHKVQSLGQKLQLPEMIDGSDEAKKTLVYRILMKLPVVPHRITPVGCVHLLPPPT